MDRREFLKSFALAGGSAIIGSRFHGRATEEEAKAWRLAGPDVTEVVCILDRSGSMSHLTGPTIESFNKFIADQQALDGKAALTLTLFNHTYDIVLNGVDIQAVKGISDETYIADGNTALLDAVGRTIGDVRDRIFKMAEDRRPNKVIFMILTDGEENSSVEYTLDVIKKRIVQCQAEYGWKFLFLGANQDAWLSGGGMGIGKGYAAAYNASPGGTQAALNTLSHTVGSLRTYAAAPSTWTPGWSTTDGWNTDWIDQCTDAMESDAKTTADAP